MARFSAPYCSGGADGPRHDPRKQVDMSSARSVDRCPRPSRVDMPWFSIGLFHAFPARALRSDAASLTAGMAVHIVCVMASAFQHIPPTPKQAFRRRARIDRLLDPELLKALAEPTRARLLSCLLKCGRACSVTEVAECCSIDFSMVARHLATMARAGLLSSEKEGRTVWYSADGPLLAARFRDLADAIDELTPEDASCDADGCGCPGDHGGAR